MKQLALTAVQLVGLIMVSMTFVGCGSNSANPANINGTWNATLLTAGNGQTQWNFGTSLVVNGDGTLSVSNFQFSSANETCFLDGATESGSFTLSGNFNGPVQGTFNFTVQATQSDNKLSLSGSAIGNTISGTWTLTGGTGCTGSGKFTMAKM